MPEDTPELSPEEALVVLKKRIALERYNPDNPGKPATRPMRVNALRGLNAEAFTKGELQELIAFLAVPAPSPSASKADHVKALSHPPLVYNVPHASLDLLHGGGLYNKLGQPLTGPITLHQLAKHRHRFIKAPEAEA